MQKIMSHKLMVVCAVFVAVIRWEKHFGCGSPSKSNNSAVIDYDGSEEYELMGDFDRPVVPKCCDLNYAYSLQNKSSCVEAEDEFFIPFHDIPDYTEQIKNLSILDRYVYFIGDPCLAQKYSLDPLTYPEENYSIFSNGSVFFDNKLVEKENFCLETVDGILKVFVCFEASKVDTELDAIFIVYAVGLLFSIPFLVLTAIIYLSVDFIRDLRGKSLACHVLCLAIAYLCLAVVQLGTDQLNEELCSAAGFIIQFFFVAAFFWLNIICYNTWRCIKNDFHCTIERSNPRSEKITFIWYLLYGFKLPFLLTFISLFMDLAPAIPDSYLKPNFGLRSCWFNTKDAALPYFYGPVGVIIFVNIIFFVLSAKKIYSKQKKCADSMARNSCSEDDIRDRSVSIRVYTKALQESIYLFGIMGITWVAEVISWFVGGSKVIWLMTDLLNASQGILIFYLFVWKVVVVRNEMVYKFHSVCKKMQRKDDERTRGSIRVGRHWHENYPEELKNSGFNLEPLVRNSAAV